MSLLLGLMHWLEIDGVGRMAGRNKHTHMHEYTMYTHAQRHVWSNSFSFVHDMPRSSHRLQLSCVKYRGRTRLYILMGTFTFWIETLTVLKLQDAAWPGETENTAYRLTSWQDALCYLTEALVCACHCIKPPWRTWKITLLSANQKKAHWVFCSVLWYLTSITLQGKDPGALFGLRRWAAILLPTFQFDNTGALKAFKICRYCQYFTNNSGWAMWWMQMCLYSELRVL